MSEKVRHPEKVNKPVNPIKKKPEWIRSKIVDSQVFFQTKQIVNQNNFCRIIIRPYQVISLNEITQDLPRKCCTIK